MPVEDDKQRTWYPAQVLAYMTTSCVTSKYVCLLLNRPLGSRQEAFLDVWNRARCRLAVDGGANVLRDFMANWCKNAGQRAKLPDFISGDFDSITVETRDFFKGCQFVHTPDQDETDFTKALRIVAEKCGGDDLEWVTAVVDTSGRLDQILANVNTLFAARRLLSAPVFQLAGDSLSWLLPAGSHVIQLPVGVRRSWCSLVPVGGPAARVTTAGLQWNLTQQRMAFDELISTSNRAVADVVTVQTSHPLLFSMEVP